MKNYYKVIRDKVRNWLGLDEDIKYFDGFNVKTAPKDDKVMTTTELVLRKRDREKCAMT